MILVLVEDERKESKHRGENGEQNRNNLMIIGTQEMLAIVIVFVNKIDAGIDRQSGEHHQRCETSESELHTTEMIDEECTNHGDRNQQNDNQSLVETFKDDAANEEDDDSHQSKQQILCSVILILHICILNTTESYWHHRIEFLGIFANDIAGNRISVNRKHGCEASSYTILSVLFQFYSVNKSGITDYVQYIFSIMVYNEASSSFSK